MKRPHLMLLCLLLIGCGTSYKAAPSTAKVATKVATAQRSLQHSQEVTKQIEVTTLANVTNATTTESHISASLDAIGRHDYVSAAQELILGRASNALVLEMLRQSMRDVQSLNGSLKQSEHDLTDAQVENGKLDKAIGKVTTQAAKDRAIVDEVNWGFRVGALLYFLKGLLAMGFWGILIIGALLIAALVIGGPTAGIAMKAVSFIFSWLRK